MLLNPTAEKLVLFYIVKPCGCSKLWNSGFGVNIPSRVFCVFVYS